MSMTREEAKEILSDWNLCHYTPSREAAEAVISALDPLEIISALRPVSREQVEQIKGVWIFNDDWWEFRCSECHKGIGNIEKYKFCPHCGDPMTDEAVKMVMERLEALKDAD